MSFSSSGQEVILSISFYLFIYFNLVKFFHTNCIKLRNRAVRTSLGQTCSEGLVFLPAVSAPRYAEFRFYYYYFFKCIFGERCRVSDQFQHLGAVPSALLLPRWERASATGVSLRRA